MEGKSVISPAMNTNVRVTGDHRSPLLQVVGIVPALSPSNSLLPHNGFYVQLSDSVNSTYVSLSDRDTDLILSNRLQLGQFAHVDQFVFDSPPVPRAVNVRPIVGRHMFIESLEALIARVPRKTGGFVIQPVTNSNSDSDPIAAYLSRTGEMRMNRRELRRVRRSLGLGKCLQQRRMWVWRRQNVDLENVDLDDVSRMQESVCSSVVPSVMVPKEENRRTSREAAIIVPSRYRQPSPTSGRQQASPAVSRKMSISMGRRLSGGLKDSSGKLWSHC